MRQVPPNGTLSVDERGVPCGIIVRPLQKRGTHVCVEDNHTGIKALRTSYGRFFIMQKSERRGWERLLFSETLATKSGSHKIAYIAVMTAFCVVANMFFEFKLADTQFSLTIVVSALTGILIGPTFGFAACFLGDLVGFLYHSAGYAYMPWIGLSMGLTAFISGGVMLIKGNGKGWLLYVKLMVVCCSTFLVCTVAINTTAFWLLYSKVSYTTYLVSRLFVQGQIWNSLFNYFLLFIFVPLLERVKPLKIRLR